MSFIAVTDITNFSPTQVEVGVQASLQATVEPSNATNKTIEWSLVSGKATVQSNGIIIPNGSESIKVRATIRNGKQA